MNTAGVPLSLPELEWNRVSHNFLEEVAYIYFIYVSKGNPFPWSISQKVPKGH